jgi:hypothetical protein
MKYVRREIRLLRWYSLTVTVLAGCFLLGAIHEIKEGSFDTLVVHRIDVVDREGKLAMVIVKHDDFPSPVVNGKSMHRTGGDDASGIVFYNQRGDEQGALNWSGQIRSDGTYDSSNTLSYDSVTTDQMLQLDDGNDNGRTFAYMVGWNRPNMNTPTFWRVIKLLEKAKTTAERDSIVAAHPSVAGARRYLFGYGEDNTSQVMLADGSGRPRVRLFVTADGRAALQFLGADGVVKASYPEMK